MHPTIKQIVRRFSIRIQKLLKEHTNDAFILRAYKARHNETPINPLDPRKNDLVFYLRHRRKKMRPMNFFFDHDWSYSITWEGLRLRVTTYGLKHKQEMAFVKLLQELVCEHDIIIMVDVTRNSSCERNEHWSKHRIVPRGRRRN